jgi:hypothetical protein
MVMLVALANLDFRNECLRSLSTAQASAVEKHVDSIIPEIIRALMPHDPREAKEAIKMFRQVSGKAAAKVGRKIAAAPVSKL